MSSQVLGGIYVLWAYFQKNMESHMQKVVQDLLLILCLDYYFSRHYKHIGSLCNKKYETNCLIQNAPNLSIQIMRYFVEACTFCGVMGPPFVLIEANSADITFSHIFILVSQIRYTIYFTVRVKPIHFLTFHHFDHIYPSSLTKPSQGLSKIPTK